MSYARWISKGSIHAANPTVEEKLIDWARRI